MPRGKVPIALAVLVYLSGCGGGGGSDSALSGSGGSSIGAPAGGQASSDSGEPDSQPALFDCQSSPPSRSVDQDAALAGVWEGTLVDCASNESSPAVAYVTEAGRVHLLVSSDGGNDLLRGQIAPDGDTFAGEGRHFDTDGGWSSELTLAGLIRAGDPIVVSSNWIVERDRMEGLWSSASGGYGYFALDFAAGQNHPPIALQDWPSEWWIKDGTFIIDADGGVRTEDLAAGGCDITGQFAAGEPAFFYDLQLRITGCSLAGDYTGVGRPQAGPFNDILVIAVDDGDQRALVLSGMSAHSDI